MKKINLLFIFFTFSISHLVSAQNEATIEKEILELHQPTQIIQDSLSQLQKEVYAKIEIEKDYNQKNEMSENKK